MTPSWLTAATWSVIQGAIMFFGGLSLLFYETVVSAEPRLIIITVAGGMIGLPATIIADRTLVRRSKDDPST